MITIVRWISDIVESNINLAELFHIVTINHNSMESKCFHPLLVDFHIMLQWSWFRLTQTVNIKDCTQIVQFVMTSKVQSFPDGTFSTFSITNQAIGSKTILACKSWKAMHYWNKIPVGGLIKELSNISHSCCYTKALSKRSSSNINKVETRSRVPFKIAVNFPQIECLFNRKQTSFSPCSIENGCSMAFGQNEAVRGFIPGFRKFIFHDSVKQNRHDFGHRSTWWRMPATMVVRC